MARLTELPLNQKIVDALSKLEEPILTNVQLLTTNLQEIDIRNRLRPLISLSRSEFAHFYEEVSKYSMGSEVSALKLLPQIDEDNYFLSTGSSRLDKLFERDYDRNNLYEIFGASGSGKTQICLTMAVLCSMKYYKVKYFTCSPTAVARRLKEIALNRIKVEENEKIAHGMVLQCLIQEILERIELCEATSLEAVMSRLNQLDEDLIDRYNGIEKGNKVKLVILDPITKLLSTSLDGSFLDNGIITSLQRTLKRIVHQQISVVVTNGAVFPPGSTTCRPALGKCWSSFSHLQLEVCHQLEDKENVYIIKDYKDNVEEYQSHTSFIITKAGVI